MENQKGSLNLRGPDQKPSTLLIANLPSFHCQICGTKHIAGTTRLKCEFCVRFL
jgi:hypothetical protein